MDDIWTTISSHLHSHVLCDALPSLPDGPEGDGLVDEEPQLVLVLEGHHGLDVAEGAVVHVDALHDQEAAGHLGLLGVLPERRRRLGFEIESPFF